MQAKEHLSVIAVIHLVLSGMGTALSLLFVLAVAVGLAEGGDFPDLGQAVLAAIGAFLVLSQVPGVAVGIGLLARKEWARVGGLVLAALYLLGIPFGTIFGIYGIYVLERPEVRALFAPSLLTNRLGLDPAANDRQQ